MMLNRTTVMAFLSFFYTCKMSPISAPILVDKAGYKVMFFIDSLIKITKYEIYESKIHANSFNLLKSRCNIDLRTKVGRSILIIDISDIGENVDKEYKIYMTTDKNKLYKSESFVWHNKMQRFELTRYVY